MLVCSWKKRSKHETGRSGEESEILKGRARSAGTEKEGDIGTEGENERK
jgi:hypothetical protein